MKSISVRLKEPTLKETDFLLQQLKTSRNKYINDAIEFYNQFQKKKLIEAQLIKESKMVAKDSMEVLAELERFEDGI